MDLYVLRHGQSTANQRQLVCGASDYALSELGHRQAFKACESLNQLCLDRVYSSPLSRARQTIETLRQDTVPLLVQELVELDTGSVSHITTAELWNFDPRYRYQGLYPNLKYPDGECLNDMLFRVQSWFEHERKYWRQGEKILICGHEGTVCGILHGLLKLEVEHYPTFSIGNCDYVHIAIDANAHISIRIAPLLMETE